MALRRHRLATERADLCTVLAAVPNCRARQQMGRMTKERKRSPKAVKPHRNRPPRRQKKRGAIKKRTEHKQRRKSGVAERGWSTLSSHDSEAAERARQERLQRAEEKDLRWAAVDRFIEEQRRTREWINFADLADWFARRDNAVVPNETARSGGYDLLRDDLLAGDFEEDGKSQVRFLHPKHETEWISRLRMVDQESKNAISLRDAIDALQPEDVTAQYLAHCWIPRRMFQRWLADHELPLSPSRFDPRGADKLENAAEAISGPADSTDAALVPTSEMPPRPAKPGPRRAAWDALADRFSDRRIPNKMSGSNLHDIVNRFVAKHRDQFDEGRIRDEISPDSVLRAAGRRK